MNTIYDMQKEMDFFYHNNVFEQFHVFVKLFLKIVLVYRSMRIIV